MKKVILLIFLIITPTFIFAATSVPFKPQMKNIFSIEESFNFLFSNSNSSIVPGEIDYDGAWAVYTAAWGDNYTKGWL